MKLRHKNKHQENFPVGMMMFNKDIRKIVADYYRFARYADDIADNPHLKPQNKVDKLYELEEIFTGQKSYKGQKLKFVQILKDEFAKHNLSPDLATDLLIAFRKDSLGFDYQTWGQLVDYCKYSAAPVGKFMLAVHQENPSTYLPATSLCVALQIVNHVQDLKYDVSLLKRLYLPSEIMKKYHLRQEDLVQNQSSISVQKAVKHIMEKTLGLVKEGSILPELIKSLSLRIEVCIILSLTNIMIKKILKGDILAREIKLSGFDWLRGIISGIYKGLTTKKKTLSYKE